VVNTKDLRPVLRIGSLAVFDGIQGTVPCKVLSITADSGAPSKQLVRFKVTAARHGYPKGYESDSSAHWVVPRKAVRRRYIVPYTVDTTPPPPTLKDLKIAGRTLGFSVKRKDGEYRVNRLGAPEAQAHYTNDPQDALGTMQEMAKGKTFYVTTYCNHAHRLSDGTPIDHECHVIPPEALQAEMNGDYDKGIELIQQAKRPVRFGPLMGQLQLPTHKGK
jgi:hypothetical protein